ncbi:MAG: PQQ-dependent sugar dehydrogenase [Algisphaera sp.]
MTTQKHSRKTIHTLAMLAVWLSPFPIHAQSSATPGPSGPPLVVHIETITTNLSGPASPTDSTDQLFPTDLVPFADNSSRTLIVTLGGVLRVLDARHQLQAQPYFNATNAKTLTGQNHFASFGFTTATFHPNFAVPKADGFGVFFMVEPETTQTQPPPDFPGVGPDNTSDRNPHHDRVLYEYTTSDPSANTLTLGQNVSKREVLRIHEPRRGHDVNDLLFDAHGYLLIAVGDNVDADLPQNRSNVFGKILRIDPLNPATVAPRNPDDRNSNNGQYRIPASNPFVDNDNTDGNSSLDEIFIEGLRNPWRLTFAPNFSALHIANVGKNHRETVVTAHGQGGENFGWPYFEGTRPNPKHPTPTAFTHIAPTFEYTHNRFNNTHPGSITGIVAYQGKIIPQLENQVLFGDTLANLLFYGDPQTGIFHLLQPDESSDPLPQRIISINQTHDGTLYLAGFDGSLARIVRSQR